MATTGYTLDNAWTAERERLDAIERLFDHGTIRTFERIQVRPGWRCLEVAGGGGSIARWLAHRAAPDGTVVATDLDTRFLDGCGEHNLLVRRHDIVTDPLERGHFDLVHTRLLLEHLPEPGAILDKLVAALRPGGWLVVEDFDWVSANPIGWAEPERFHRISEAIGRLFTMAGGNLSFGRTLPLEFANRGLEQVSAEGRAPAVRGGSPEVAFFTHTLEQLQPKLLEFGLLTPEDVENVQEAWENPDAWATTQLLVAAVGRRPW
ncbi:MAG: class I SAM-dependent methyltransferase [Candidatus Dormibacteria bacterium]